jgi:prepilin-type N-terminal cleavage/methylation domain-containing protein
MQRAHNSSRGFTLVELMITACIGAVLVASAALLFNKGTQMAWVTTQKAELQQDFRAASNLLQRDISLAGAGALGQQGLATSTVALANGGAAVKPVYPCSVVGGVSCTYINGGSVAYPSYNAGPPAIYSIIPGSNLGITVTAAQGPTDIITLNYADINLPLDCYSATLTATNVVTFTLPAAQNANCILPVSAVYGVGNQPPGLIWGSANPYGLQPGDIILFGSDNAVGVVTSVANCGANCYAVTFGSDPGKVNQFGVATSGTLVQAATPQAVGGAMPALMTRLLSITYYLAIPPSTSLPTLFRIQNGQPPAPVAENVVYLKFCYDIINAGVVSTCQSPLPGNTTPSMITKVNIQHMSMRSQNRDSWSRSNLSQYGGYEGLDLQTSIAVRNMTMQNEYGF